jgi:hypothetical protein
MLANLAHSMFHHAVVQVRRAGMRRLVHRVVARTRPSDKPGDPASTAVAAKIDEAGYVLLGSPFEATKLHKLRSAIEDCECFDQWHPEKGRFRLEDVPDHVNSGRVIGVGDIPEAREIANDPQVLAIATAYLGCRPHIDEPLAWWSFPRPSAYQEQFFHRDNPSSRWLKLFVYLADVGPNDGPHVFVRSSHKTNELLKTGARFTDQAVREACGSERVVEITGPFGTAFLEDTYGLHKGELPKVGTRLVLEVTYSAYAVPKPVFSDRAAGSPPETA